MIGPQRCAGPASPASLPGFVLLVVLTLSAVTMMAQQEASQDTPVFRATSTGVSIDLSVKRGGRAVMGLTAADFGVTDNGVRQTVEQVLQGSAPIDVTLIIDASGSTATIFETIRRHSQRILGLLRPQDRVRVLVIETIPYELVPLQAVGLKFALPQERLPGNLSSIYDTLLAALVTSPDPERRRLVVALTDGIDTKSITSMQVLENVVRRTDTVLHLIAVHTAAVASTGPAPPRSSSLGFMRDQPTKPESELFEALPALTGGAFHGPRHDSRNKASVDVVEAVRDVLQDFRQSYVIQYQPRDVATSGWHDIVVRVKGVDRKGVRARAGYFGEAP